MKKITNSNFNEMNRISGFVQFYGTNENKIRLYALRPGDRFYSQGNFYKVTKNGKIVKTSENDVPRELIWKGYARWQ